MWTNIINDIFYQLLFLVAVSLAAGWAIWELVNFPTYEE